jgi:Xaa-Pro aminopeptidase
MTRTWCIGQAPDDVRAAYEEVREIFDKIVGALKVGEYSGKYQEMTLDDFESRRHPTQRNKPGTLEGYVHSLGHGLGLNVHEAPNLSVITRGSNLAPGNVFTVEPGLYYPDRGFGVRLEDTVYLDPASKLHTLTDFPYDLVIPLHGQP